MAVRARVGPRHARPGLATAADAAPVRMTPTTRACGSAVGPGGGWQRNQTNILSSGDVSDYKLRMRS